MNNSIYAIFTAALIATTSVGASLPDFTELVDDIVPAVVHIETTRYGDRPTQEHREPTEQELPELFRRFFDFPFGEGPRGRPDVRGGGSGFIISEDGLIITNHHVIEQADEIIVSLTDRREFEAELVGSDAGSDIALLRIDADHLPVARLGDSAALRQGEWVIAIGSPFGYASTVTAGIISAKGRSARGMQQQQYVPFIQTDVAINRGNSGGPLINMDGEVVGINSWILSSHGGNIGLSFAIPIEIAQNTMEQLLEYGRVSRGLLGVNIQDVNRDLADNLGLDRPVGALVSGINPGSAAERAGIEVGDVIVQFDGRDVDTSSDLPPMVGVVRPGTEVDLVVWRDGRRVTLTTELDELEGDIDPTGRGPADGPASDNALGLTVEPIGADERRRLGDPEGGVLITAVDSDRAYRAGVRRGQVILSINNQTISGMDDFRAIVDEIEPDRSVALLIWQGGQTRFIAYTPETG